MSVDPKLRFAEAEIARLQARVAELARTAAEHLESGDALVNGLLIALDQARGLLERESTVARDDPDHIEARHNWLRAHPATNSPSSDLVVASKTSLTPAATVAEPCPGCGREYKHCPSAGDECWRDNGCPSTPPRAAKEAKGG